MIEQIKYILWKLLFVSAAIALYSTFNIVTDAEEIEQAVNLLSANIKVFIEK